jgi:hypothetical protein
MEGQNNQPCNREYKRQLESFVGRSAIYWIGSGIYLFTFTPGASFFSWQAATFFLVGPIVASSVFGVVFYAIQRGLGWLLNADFPVSGGGTFTRLLAIALFVGHIAVIFLAAREYFPILLRAAVAATQN